jgi:glutathione S-transferase
LRAHWALRELGLPYESHPVRARSAETRSAQYREINPKLKIPTLLIGELAVSESAAIVTHLAEMYGEPTGLIPRSGTHERATYHEWCFFCMTELDAGALYVLRRHLGLRELFGDAPAAVQAARDSFGRLIQAAEQRLAAHGPFIAGGTFTGADILLTSCLLWAQREDLPLSDTLLRYVAMQTDRQAYRAAVAANAWPA